MFSINVTPKWKDSDAEGEIFSLKISSDASLIGSTLSNGQIALRSVTTGRLSYSLTHSAQGFPVTSIRFHPSIPKLFLTISSDGSIKEWNNSNPQVTWSLPPNTENSLYALDYDNSGSRFATGGSDASIRLYDATTKQLIQTFSRKKFDMTSPYGHSDRIYSIKIHPTDDSLMFTGGWDNTIQVWDIRTNSPIAISALYGPHICGNSLDVKDNLILSGSWRTHEQIQIWDMRTFKMIKSLRWSLAGDDHQCSLYYAQFIPNGKYFIAGGSGVNQLRAFSLETFSTIGSVLYFESPVFDAGILPNCTGIAVGTQKDGISFHPMNVPSL